jgi:hypothetical protein
MTCISNLSGRVMVTDLNIGFLGTKLYKIRGVLGHGEPPSVRSSCEGCNWSAIYDNRSQVGHQRWAVGPCICGGAHKPENRDSFSPDRLCITDIQQAGRSSRLAVITVEHFANWFIAAGSLFHVTSIFYVLPFPLMSIEEMPLLCIQDRIGYKSTHLYPHRPGCVIQTGSQRGWCFQPSLTGCPTLS